MGDNLDTCPTCHGSLIEIDRYRERLDRVQPLALAWE
jgi:hypothetical protein